MSVSWPGNMRGPQVKTPLLLLLLLLTSLTGTVLCQDDEGVAETDALEVEHTEETPTQASPTSPPSSSDGSLDTAEETTEGESSGEDPGLDNSETATGDPNFSSSTSTPLEEEEGLSPIIILIPVVLVVVIIAIIVVCIFIKRRWNKKAENQDLRKEDPYLEDASAEKVPMPMFEEDVPSVLELEMEELDQWMKKDGETAEDSKQA